MSEENTQEPVQPEAPKKQTAKKQQQAKGTQVRNRKANPFYRLGLALDPGETKELTDNDQANEKLMNVVMRAVETGRLEFVD